MPILTTRNRRARLLVLVVALAAGTASAAPSPSIQLVPDAVAPGTCAGAGPTPQIAANLVLGPADTFRYSPAYVVPFFFDDEGEFNVAWNQDATLLVSSYLHVEGTHLRTPLPVAPLSAWFAGFGRLPEHTELAFRAAAYDASGRAVATSRITWDCTSGTILRVEHRGNAAVPIPARLVEYHHTALDHYFMTADAGEVAMLDSGKLAGWQRTGQAIDVAAAPLGTAAAVCRIYLPPASGDSHFYSASTQECADVRARFPSFVYEAAAVFAAPLPDTGTGECATGKPVYRLWNARADSNHRYTTDPSTRVAMVAKGYVAEGYGAYGVAFCTVP